MDAVETPHQMIPDMCWELPTEEDLECLSEGQQGQVRDYSHRIINPTERQ